MRQQPNEPAALPEPKRYDRARLLMALQADMPKPILNVDEVERLPFDQSIPLCLRTLRRLQCVCERETNRRNKTAAWLNGALLAERVYKREAALLERLISRSPLPTQTCVEILESAEARS